MFFLYNALSSSHWGEVKHVSEFLMNREIRPRLDQNLSGIRLSEAPPTAQLKQALGLSTWSLLLHIFILVPSENKVVNMGTGF